MRIQNNINFAAAKAAILAAAQRAAHLGAEHVLTESRKMSPIEEGTLERSSSTSVETTGSTVRAAVSYNTVYAARQHEELTWRHDPGRQAKYLEQPLHAEGDTVAQIAATELRKAL